MVGAAVAAVLAIVVGARIGRDLLTGDDPPAKPTAATVVTFHETVSDVSLSYPATWTRRATVDEELPLVAAAPGGRTALLVRRSQTGLAPVTRATLPVAKKFTDPLFRAIKGAKLLEPARPVELGGLVGWRYTYTYGGGQGVHDHYFLFKGGLLIALVFQATPANRLNTAAPAFARIAASFRSGPGG